MGKTLEALRRYYRTPQCQVILIGLICFCCPGMFNAVNGMGGGGQEDAQAADNGLTALYATFAVFGLLGGGFYNLLGPQITLLFGSSFYILYVGSYLYYNHHSSQAFVIAAGALLGMGAGLLWAAQGAILTAYPAPNRKGMSFSLFWCIFNLGGVLGGFIPFALNYHSTYGGVNDQTYIAFMSIMAFGALLSLALSRPEAVVRHDGSHVESTPTSAPIEALHVIKLFTDWRMLLLAPACFASNFFYTYQFNNVNAAIFNVRTRAFNNVFYWAAQMVGSVAMGVMLDRVHTKRKVRGVLGVAALAALSTTIWTGGLLNQLRYTRSQPIKPKIDFRDGVDIYAGPFSLYFSYGLLDAMFQTLCYWCIGAIADDPCQLSRYSGFYKGVQSAGAAVAWHIDTLGVSFIAELAINWALMTVSFPLLLILIILAVREPPPSVHLEPFSDKLEMAPTKHTLTPN